MVNSIYMVHVWYCPKCKKEMTLVSKDISHDFKKKKKYSRKIFHCEKDDVWISLEIPLK